MKLNNDINNNKDTNKAEQYLTFDFINAFLCGCFRLIWSFSLYSFRFSLCGTIQSFWQTDSKLFREQQKAQWWKNMALDNGIVTRKLSQTFACDEKLFHTLTSKALGELSDEVERMSNCELDNLMTQAYGTPKWYWKDESESLLCAKENNNNNNHFTSNSSSSCSSSSSSSSPFILFDRIPFNSGCIAQVHRAIIAIDEEDNYDSETDTDSDNNSDDNDSDNENEKKEEKYNEIIHLKKDKSRSTTKVVAVKIYRSGIVKEIKLQLMFVEFILSFFLNIVLKYFRPRLYSIAGKIRLWDRFLDLKSDLLAQTDSNTEVQNLIDFKQICGFMNAIYVPKVYPKLCRPQVVIEEFIYGISLTAMRDPIYADQKQKVCEELIKFYLHSLFRLKKSHGDAHKGNFRLRLYKNKDKQDKKGIIGIFDLGLMHSKSPWQLYMMRTMLQLMHSGKWLDFVIHVYDMFVEKDIDLKLDINNTSKTTNTKKITTNNHPEELIEAQKKRCEVWFHIYALIKSGVCQDKPTLGFFSQLFEYIAEQPHVLYRTDFNDLDISLLNLDYTMKEMDPNYHTFHTLYLLMKSAEPSTTKINREQELEEEKEELGNEVFALPDKIILERFFQKSISFKSSLREEENI